VIIGASRFHRILRVFEDILTTNLLFRSYFTSQKQIHIHRRGTCEELTWAENVSKSRAVSENRRYLIYVHPWWGHVMVGDINDKDQEKDKNDKDQRSSCEDL